MEGEELASAFASADAFVFPSVTETLGLVILEGMASGLPVVAARSGPTMEQVTDGVNGLIFDSGDEARLDAALNRLADSELRERIRKAARAEAEKFSWENASDDLLHYYEMAIEKHSRRSLSLFFPAELSHGSVGRAGMTKARPRMLRDRASICRR